MNDKEIKKNLKQEIKKFQLVECHNCKQRELCDELDGIVIDCTYVYLFNKLIETYKQMAKKDKVIEAAILWREKVQTIPINQCCSDECPECMLIEAVEELKEAIK